LQLTAGKVKIATISTVELQVPDTEGFIHADQSKDRAQELHAVEKIRE
jgi:alpha-acetolactate decarboxylase